MEAVRTAPDVSPAPSLLAEVPGWYEDARCIDADPDVFFPEKGGSTVAAVTLCRSCPAVDACRDYAVADATLVGVWGGTSEKDRKALRRDPDAS